MTTLARDATRTPSLLAMAPGIRGADCKRMGGSGMHRCFVIGLMLLLGVFVCPPARGSDDDRVAGGESSTPRWDADRGVEDSPPATTLLPRTWGFASFD